MDAEVLATMASHLRMPLERVETEHRVSAAASDDAATGHTVSLRPVTALLLG
jgi:hypothetical protein